MTREEIETRMVRAEYFDGYLCPACKQPLFAYSGRMNTIETHRIILGPDLIGSDYLLLHPAGSACVLATFVAGVSDQQYSKEVEGRDFVKLS